MIVLFGRKAAAAADLEEAVRRRIAGRDTKIEAAVDCNETCATVNAEQPSEGQASASGEKVRADESLAQLLRDLAGALKRGGVEISTVRATTRGFFVSGARKGATFRRWYSVGDVRQLDDVDADGIRF